MVDRVLTGLTVGVALAVLLVVMRQSRSAEPEPALALPVQELPLVASRVIGSTAARVGIVEFTDFECPYCARFSTQVLPSLHEEFIKDGRVLLMVRHFPLPNHSHARTAALAAECAGNQGRLLEMHDALFRASPRLSRDDLSLQAAALDLNAGTFETCLSTGDFAGIDEDIVLAKSIGVRGTPSFVVGMVKKPFNLVPTHTIVGARPLDHFRTVLQELSASVP